MKTSIGMINFFTRHQWYLDILILFRWRKCFVIVTDVCVPVESEGVELVDLVCSFVSLADV